MLKKITSLLFASACLSFTINAQKPKYDYVIKKVTVFDGSGREPIVADVAIAGDTIAFFGKKIDHKYDATKTIKGKGLYLSPGFIDPHTHYYSLLTNEKDSVARMLPRALMQGVTSVFVGSDGSSPMPTAVGLRKIDKMGVGPNVAFFVGHSSVRSAVLGQKDVQPTPEELHKMEKIVETSMKAGAFGISTGLFYTPANYAKTSEVVALSKVAAKYGGIYDTHQRDEGEQSIGIIASTNEVLNIAREAKIPVHFSHIKVDGPLAWPKTEEMIKVIEDAQKEGLNVTANQYTFTASGTALIAAVIPAWARDGGTAALRDRYKDPVLRDSILKQIKELIAIRTGDAAKLFLYIATDKKINGKNLQQVADDLNVSPEEAVIQITERIAPYVISFSMREEDVEKLMKKPWVMTGSDGGSTHPRGHSTFSRLIDEYVMKRKVISLSNAIYRSSYLTAQTFKIQKRGLIKAGNYADLFLFNPKTYKSNNSFENAHVLTSGVKFLWVNGKLAIDDEQLVNSMPGKGLRLNKP